jgi:O-antigen/teichoic acid export membrane protein
MSFKTNHIGTTLARQFDRSLEIGGGWLKVDLKYFVKGSSWLLAQQTTGAVFGFLLSLIYSRFLPKQTFGQYNFVFSFIAIFGGFANPGMFTAAVRAVAQGREQIIRIASWRTFRWAILSAIPLGLIGIYYLLKTSPDWSLAQAFFLAAVLAVPYWTFNFHNAYFIGTNQLKRMFICSLFSTMVFFAAMSYVSIFSLSVVNMVLASLGSNTLTFLIINRKIFRQLPQKKALKADLHYASKLNDVRIFAALIAFSDKIILGKLIGFEAIAIYSFSQIMPEQIKMTLKNIAVLALPKLSQTTIKGRKRRFYFNLVGYFIFCSVIAILYVLLAPTLFSLFFPTYGESVPLTRITAVTIATAPVLIVSSLFESQATIGLIRLFIYSSYAFQAVTFFVFTLIWGLMGSVLALSLTSVFSFLIALIILEKSHLLD